jgi:hypothetical protein
MPKVVGLGLMTDGDSLGQTLRGDYADLQLFGGQPGATPGHPAAQ